MGAKDKIVKHFEEGEMTMKEFLKYLQEKYIANLNGKPFTLNYAHSIANYGRMPRHYGGNVLRVRKVRGVKTVKIMPEKFEFYQHKKDYEVPPGQVNAS